MKKIIYLGISLILLMGSGYVVQAQLAVGDTFNYGTVSKREYTNPDGDTFKWDYKTSTKMKITGLNSTWLNYTFASTEDVYSTSVDLDEGTWIQITVDGSKEFVGRDHFNLTEYEQDYDYAYFYMMDRPTWHNTTSHFEEYWGANVSTYDGGWYEDRYDYFDPEEEENMNSLSFWLYVPNAVDDPKAFLSRFEDKMSDEIDRTVKTFETVTYNASAESWSQFRSEEFEYWIAYQATLLDADTGLVRLTPEWRGYYNYLNNLWRWNGTHMERRVASDSPNITSMDSPVTYDSGTGKWGLNNDSQYFGRSYLNTRDPSYRDYFSSFEAEYTDNSVILDFTVLYEETIYDHFYDVSDKAAANLTFHYEVEYDENGLLRKEIQEVTYDGGDLGKYKVYWANGIGIKGTETDTDAIYGLEFPILFISFAISTLIAIKLRKPKLK